MYQWNPDEIPILQLGSDFYDPVQAAVFPEKKLRYQNPELNLNFDIRHLADFRPLPDNIPTPLALRYHGHQFQHYNPDLGDGRGFLFAQIQQNSQWYDLGTKGSGQTPYSRQGDGRLTLKGAVREALATEMLQSLGVNTSRTLCFFETGENLVRNDEPSPTRAAVLTRFSKGHIRIGTFQRLAFLKQFENIKKLASYSLFFYYPQDQVDPEDLNLIAARLLQNVVESNAELVAQVMMAGFVHGVLNTDNINISGELFDYGPYRFMPTYNPEFTAAYFDQQGLYCYGRQPASFLWALHQLGGCLKTAFPDLPAAEILDGFSERFNFYVQKYFFKRLNLKATGGEKDSLLLAKFFSLMEKNNLNFEQTFFDFRTRTLKKYEALDPEILNLLQDYEVADDQLFAHEYFKRSTPDTLLIDEIESIWAPIAQNDEWSLFNNKLHSNRSWRGLY